MNRKRVVIASGAFDLLHLGHVRFLEKAKEAGGKDAELVVVVARNGTVKKMKGNLPVLPEKERRTLVEALKPVDKAVLGSKNLDIPSIIKQYQPDVIAVGYDQHKIERMVKDFVQREGLATKVVRIRRFGLRELDSSSKIKRRIVSSSR